MLSITTMTAQTASAAVWLQQMDAVAQDTAAVNLEAARLASGNSIDLLSVP